MKKYYRPVIAAFLVMILCVSLAGCSCGKKNETTNNSEVTLNNEKSSGSETGETAPASETESEGKEGTDSPSDKTQPAVSESEAGEGAGSTLEGTIETEAGEMPEDTTDVQEEVVIELEEGYASGGM